MKIIETFSCLCNYFKDRVSVNPSKPVLIWFGRGEFSNLIIDRFNKEFINPNLDILKRNTGGVIEKCGQSAIVYHRYVDQMEESFLREILLTKRKSKKPIFVLANTYSTSDKPDWVKDFFEEILYEPIMEVALIACSSTKKSLRPGERVWAEELYMSPLFKKSWAYADTLGIDAKYMLSDKYGLLKGTDKIQSYDVSLKGMSSAEKSKWAKGIIADLKRRGYNPAKDRFIFLAGQQYIRELTRPGMLENYSSVFKSNDLSGIGHILHFFKSKGF